MICMLLRQYLIVRASYQTKTGIVVGILSNKLPNRGSTVIFPAVPDCTKKKLKRKALTLDIT